MKTMNTLQNAAHDIADGLLVGLCALALCVGMAGVAMASTALVVCTDKGDGQTPPGTYCKLTIASTDCKNTLTCDTTGTQGTADCKCSYKAATQSTAATCSCKTANNDRYQ